jgi:hypothetical protein
MTIAKPKRAARRFLWCVVVPFVSAVAALVVVPQVGFRVAYGRGPLEANPASVVEGMSPDEVIAILGPPHKREYEAGQAIWTYFQDSYTLDAIQVKFKKTGEVRHWWIR